MSDPKHCNCEQSLRLIECLEHSNAVIAAQAAELTNYKADIVLAAGELLMPIPEPGTITAELLAVISILKREKRDLLRLIEELKAGEHKL